MSEYRTALVTGASSGLGRGLALALARRGTKVYAAARRRPQLDSLVQEGGGNIESMILDVAQADATHDAVAALDQKDPLDLVIANAGIGGHTPAQKLDWKILKSVLEVNLIGAAATLAGALPGMVARDRGHLAAVSSLAAWSGLPGQAGYSGSKAGLSTLMESLGVDLYGTGVAVTTICPGFVKTELTAKNKFPMPFMLELDQAVRIMMASLDKREAVCAFPLPLVMAMKALPFLPRPVYQFMASKSKPDR
jgi:short-subunit dehydrogenase